MTGDVLNQAGVTYANWRTLQGYLTERNLVRWMHELVAASPEQPWVLTLENPNPAQPPLHLGLWVTLTGSARHLRTDPRAATAPASRCPDAETPGGFPDYLEHRHEPRRRYACRT